MVNRVLGLLSRLPLPLCRGLAQPLATLIWYLPWRKHALIASNIAQAFPQWTDLARRQLQRDSLHHAAQLLMEAGAVWHWPWTKLDKAIQCEGWQHVEAAMAGGRGLLLVGCHLGNWEIQSLYVFSRIPMVGLFTAPKQAALTDALTQSRQRFGGQLVPAGTGAVRHMLKALNQGKAVGIIADQQPKRGHGVMAPWFGQPAPTMTLVAQLAQRTGCVVLITSCTRNTDPGSPAWTLRFTPAATAIRDPDVALAATALNQALEAEIRRAPAQYLWSYRRYPVSPE